jgi:hypothetical protein
VCTKCTVRYTFVPRSSRRPFETIVSLEREASESECRPPTYLATFQFFANEPLSGNRKNRPNHVFPGGFLPLITPRSVLFYAIARAKIAPSVGSPDPAYVDSIATYHYGAGVAIHIQYIQYEPIR